MSTTEKVILVAISTLVAYDLVAVFTDLPTISRVMYTWAVDFAIVGYGWGVLAGHFFSHGSPGQPEKWRTLALIIISIGVAVLDLLTSLSIDPMVTCLSGIFVGYFFWPLERRQ